MTDPDLARIEGGLAILLPMPYRRLMLARHQELEAVCLDEIVFLTADDVIINNLMERKPGSGTDYAFPGWWKMFFLIGTNGGGAYYCLRLDHDDKVWMIGSDMGDRPMVVENSLEDFVDKELEDYRENTA